MRRLREVSALEFLTDDPRPTFVVDLDTVDKNDKHAVIDPVYSNTALLVNKVLHLSITGRYHDIGSVVDWNYTYNEFRNWVFNGHKDEPGAKSSKTQLFQGHVWSRFTLHGENTLIVLSASMFSNFANRYVVQDSESEISSDTVEQRENTLPRTTSMTIDNGLNSRSFRSRASPVFMSIPHTPSSGQHPKPSRSQFDWTTAELDTLDLHLQYARSVHWEDTPLGPIST